MIDIAKARALCAEATPGPWYVSSNGVVHAGGEPDVDGNCDDPEVADMSCNLPKNRIFIAAARTGWPEALAEIERLKSTIDCWAQIETERDTLKAEVELVRDLHKKAVDERARLRKALETWASWWNNVGREHYRFYIVPPLTETEGALAAPQTGGDDE